MTSRSPGERAGLSAMIRKIIQINELAIIGLTLIFVIYPVLRGALDLMDPALSQPGVPKAAWRLYRSLTPRYLKWARQHVAGGRAENLSTNDVSGTEWPLFGSVFFLWSMENLQDAWDAGDHAGGVEPKVFAREAMIAASELVIDPKHATWVKKHWGEDYLHRENVFYRMLVMAALTSRARLCQDGAHLDLLRDQVETFSRELDQSKSGLLDDYPGECYPGDVMAAVMCLKRADAVLGTDHATIVRRAIRGFEGRNATRFQLPPYSANANTGLPTSEARGCANAYLCLTGPELWPLQSRQWFALYDRFFWQERFGIQGFREFPKLVAHSDWMFDVDAGPVIAGYGIAANAFGVGAARKNARFDRAYPLTCEMLATCWELPNGALAMPRLLSNLNDAPLLGEAGILWQLSIQPQKGFPVKMGGAVPIYVYVLLIGAFLIGAWRILESVVVFRRAGHVSETEIMAPAFQIVCWFLLIAATILTVVQGHPLIGLAPVILAVMLPIQKRKRRPKGVEDWPGHSTGTAEPREPKKTE
jgi:hypothetical protein